MAQRLAQDGPHVVVSSQKQQNVDLAVAALQEEGLSTVGTMCHRGRQGPGAAGGHSKGPRGWKDTERRVCRTPCLLSPGRGRGQEGGLEVLEGGLRPQLLAV